MLILLIFMVCEGFIVFEWVNVGMVEVTETVYTKIRCQF